MHLTELDVAIIHHIFEELPVKTLLILRQTCRSLRSATYSKIVWIRQMELLEEQGAIIPSYAQNYRPLQPIILEALVLRLSSVADKWTRQDMAPTKCSSLAVPRSITWLRIVDGRYVFAAFSDQKLSSIACWDMWWLPDGNINPIAEAFLPGRVNTAQVDMQEDGIVLALGLDGNSTSVLVTTLQMRHNKFELHELARIEHSSHILLLEGPFLGCAVRTGVNVPHLVNWKDGTFCEIPVQPGTLESPDRASVPHLMTISEEILVIVRSTGIEIYHCPLSTSEPIVFIRHIATSPIWEAVATSRASSQGIQLTFITRVGLETLVIDSRVLDTGSEPPGMTCVARAPSCGCCGPSTTCDYIYHSAPWYGLCVGSTGRQCMWVSVAEDLGNRRSSPCLVSARLPPVTGGPLDSAQVVSWPINPEYDMALWALPRFDFDEALGTTVVGNCFGELDFYDLDEHLKPCLWLSRDPFWRSIDLLPKQILSESPIPLDILPQPVALATESFHDSTSHWSQDQLEDLAAWSTDWEHYRQVHLWQGMPCDYAWLLSEAFGFPGRVVPQAYSEQCEGEPEQMLVFRIGQRYFLLTQGDENIFRTCPVDLGRQNLFTHLRGPKLVTTRRTAITARQTYISGLSTEVYNDPDPRNRWLEMQKRGGYVEWSNLECQFVGQYMD
ncbi:hypothetical protein MIND_00770200 [Mycena indigotica]|uniref:F-box domain-containing protein n=1 Tax=Mycena indigotica TaxID=2126181 RepID=A0A8H6SLX5_9AGAR|nr:uncharacterized protein MIND_00770200 [Mycena indigotica]KAF7302038.1 hypothetical protein MIND_00770200 [Mycena indigotica]